MYILVYTVSKNQTDAHRSGQGGQECRIWCSPLHSQLEHWERQCGKPSIHHPKMSLKNGTNHPQMVGLLLGCRHWWDIPRSMRSHYDVKLSQAPLFSSMQPSQSWQSWQVVIKHVSNISICPLCPFYLRRAVKSWSSFGCKLPEPPRVWKQDLQEKTKFHGKEQHGFP